MTEINKIVTITDDDRRFMKMACDLASENLEHGGGPLR